MSDASASVDLVDRPLATLALTVTEKQYALTSTLASAGKRKVTLICDTEWLYAAIAGGPYFLVPAKYPVSILVNTVSQSVFAKVVTTNGTLYLLPQVIAIL